MAKTDQIVFGNWLFRAFAVALEMPIDRGMDVGEHGHEPFARILIRLEDGHLVVFNTKYADRTDDGRQSVIVPKGYIDFLDETDIYLETQKIYRRISVSEQPVIEGIIMRLYKLYSERIDDNGGERKISLEYQDSGIELPAGCDDDLPELPESWNCEIPTGVVGDGGEKSKGIIELL